MCECCWCWGCDCLGIRHVCAKINSLSKNPAFAGSYARSRPSQDFDARTSVCSRAKPSVSRAWKSAVNGKNVDRKMENGKRYFVWHFVPCHVQRLHRLYVHYNLLCIWKRKRASAAVAATSSNDNLNATWLHIGGNRISPFSKCQITLWRIHSTTFLVHRSELSIWRKWSIVNTIQMKCRTQQVNVSRKYFTERQNGRKYHGCAGKCMQEWTTVAGGAAMDRSSREKKRIK